MQEANRLKKRVQTGILIISAVLMGGKFLAFIMTNSVGVLTDALESIVNVVAGAISLYSICLSSKPKDKSHPFGHGKVELLSASLEGIMIIVAGTIIIVEGIDRCVKPTEIRQIDIGIYIVALAGLVNYILGWYSIKIGKKHNSVAMVASGKHLQSDTYSTIGLVIGLIAVYFTNLTLIDGILAIIFGGIIMITGLKILKETSNDIVDKADERVLTTLLESLKKDNHHKWIDIHNVKLLKYGSNVYVICDLTIPYFYSIREGHIVCDKLGETLAKDFGDRVMLNIHTDPCNSTFCKNCYVKNCDSRGEPFKEYAELSITEITQDDEERKEKKNIMRKIFKK